MNFKTACSRAAISSVLIFVNLGILNAQALPAGTRLRLKLDVEISSRFASVNDTFKSVVTEPVILRDVVVVPAGSIVTGHVSGVRSAALGKNGSLRLAFDSLRIPLTSERDIEAELASPLRPRTSPFLKAIWVAGGIVGGSVIGASAKGGTGALIGGAAGAGIGTAFAFLHKGKNVGIPAEQEFDIVIKKDVTLPVLDY